MDSTTSVASRAAERLLEAASTRVPCAPVRDLIGLTDIDLAYEVQNKLTAARLADGAVVVGRKTGATSKAVQDQLGVDQPDFGVLFEDMDVSAYDEVPGGRLIQPKAEAEVAFVLEEDLVDGALEVADVRKAVAYAVAAIEIVDSRIEAWDIKITDTVADNASSGLYVLSDTKVSLDGFDPVDVEMALFDGSEQVSSGSGAACLGDPLNALSWLAKTARDFGEPLRAGQVVLSGALGAMVTAQPGHTIRAEITDLGSVTVRFAQED
jgi:2-keto-4-pentenoate hydratase